MEAKGKDLEYELVTTDRLLSDGRKFLVDRARSLRREGLALSKRQVGMLDTIDVRPLQGADTSIALSPEDLAFRNEDVLHSVPPFTHGCLVLETPWKAGGAGARSPMYAAWHVETVEGRLVEPGRRDVPLCGIEREMSEESRANLDRTGADKAGVLVTITCYNISKRKAKGRAPAALAAG